MALLTVLFILVLITVLSVYLVEDEHIALRRISNLRDFEQGYQMAAGAEHWALKVLERDGRQNEVDHLNEPWSNLLPEVKVEEGTLLASVSDLHGLFNINNLAAGRDEVWYPVFVRLLSVLELDESLADALVDWIDNDQDVTGSNGAEDPDYLSLDPSYRAGNRMLVDIGELMWVKGFDDKALTKLSPFVTALPVRDAKINVNTSSPLLLSVITKEILTEAEVESLISGRGEQGYPNVDSFLTRTELAAEADNVQPLITVASDYFEVRSEAKFGRLTTVSLSVVHRRPGGEQVTVIQRRRGLS